MKVILLQDVANVGRRFETVNVPNGFALNKLIPQGFAETATPENVKRVKAREAKLAADRTESDAQFAAAVAALSDKTIEVAAEANEEGHLYEALKAERIAEALTEAGVNISVKQVTIPAPIKEVGEHTVVLQEGKEEQTCIITVVKK